MKFGLIGLLMLAASPAALAAESPPQIPFDGDVNFLKMPKDTYLGEVSGVAVNSQGHVFVFRGRRDDTLKILWATGDGLCLLANYLASYYNSFNWM